MADVDSIFQVYTKNKSACLCITTLKEIYLTQSDPNFLKDALLNPNLVNMVILAACTSHKVFFYLFCKVQRFLEIERSANKLINNFNQKYIQSY